MNGNESISYMLDLQRRYCELEADVRSLALMAIGQADSMFESDNDFVNMIAKGIQEDKKALKRIKSEQYGLQQENPDPQLRGVEAQGR